MITNTIKSSPAQVADECEMLAQEQIDECDCETAELFMEPAHAIRRLLLTLHRLNQRVHSGYDFNADPDRMTLEVGEVLKDYNPPTRRTHLRNPLNSNIEK